ncbi:MAG TPA: AraC family transcriptional regulator [Bacilli bacterium]
MIKKETGLAAEAFLNQSVLRLKGDEASFIVHYWGVMPYHYDNPVHKHSFFEVCYVVAGSGSYLDNGILFELKPGTLFCSRPEVWHQIRSEFGMFLIYVAFEFIEAESGQRSAAEYHDMLQAFNYITHAGDDESVIMVWKALLHQAGNATLGLTEAVKSLGYALLCSFPQVFNAQKSGQPGSDRGRLTRMSFSRVLNQAQMFIRDNLSQPLLLDDVAATIHVSRRHLSRLFSEQTGQTYIHYVKQERIRHAAHVLKTTNRPIKEIAELTGFGSVHYFTNVFTAEMGRSPGQYRRDPLWHQD